jgi:hypothetical protein
MSRLRDHTQTHNRRQDSPRGGIDPSQRPLTAHNIHNRQTSVPGGIRNHKPKPQAAWSPESSDTEVIPREKRDKEKGREKTQKKGTKKKISSVNYTITRSCDSIQMRGCGQCR